MLKSREKYHPQYFSAVVGNFYKGREQSRNKKGLPLGQDWDEVVLSVGGFIRNFKGNFVDGKRNKPIVAYWDD